MTFGCFHLVPGFQTEEMNKMFTDQTEENLKGWTNDFTEKYTVYQFEGEDFRNKNAGKIDDLDTWIALPKRERKQLYDLTGTASSSRDSPPWTPKLLKQKDKRPSVRIFVPSSFCSDSNDSHIDTTSTGVSVHRRAFRTTSAGSSSGSGAACLQKSYRFQGKDLLQQTLSLNCMSSEDLVSACSFFTSKCSMDFQLKSALHFVSLYQQKEA